MSLFSDNSAWDKPKLMQVPPLPSKIPAGAPRQNMKDLIMLLEDAIAMNEDPDVMSILEEALFLARKM